MLSIAEVLEGPLPGELESRGPSPAAEGVNAVLGQPDADASGNSSSANSSPPPTLGGQHEHHPQRHHRHHHHRDEGKRGHPRRHSHKPSQQLQKPSVPRQNAALSALSDTELEVGGHRSRECKPLKISCSDHANLWNCDIFGEIVPNTKDSQGYSGFRVVMGMGKSSSQE